MEALEFHYFSETMGSQAFGTCVPPNQIIFQNFTKTVPPNIKFHQNGTPNDRKMALF